MRTYIIKRILLMIPTLLGITIVTIAIIHIAPGEPPAATGGTQAVLTKPITKELIEQWRKLHDLDKPLYVQYWKWLKRIGRLDFGVSFKDGRSVIKKVQERLPITLTLNFISIFLIYIIAVPLGIHSATHQFKLSDKVITFLLFVLYSLPVFWVGHLFLTYASGAEYLNLFPLIGTTSITASKLNLGQRFFDFIWHIILPVVCLTYPGLARLSRYARAGMLEVVRQDYIRTARAKGLPEKIVILQHAFRNSVITIVTLFGFLLPQLLGGSVIIEQIFSIPGIGRLGFEAVLNRDFPVIMAIATITAFLTLIGILISDILYAVVDPRISYEKTK